MANISGLVELGVRGLAEPAATLAEHTNAVDAFWETRKVLRGGDQRGAARAAISHHDAPPIAGQIDTAVSPAGPAPITRLLWGSLAKTNISHLALFIGARRLTVMRGSIPAFNKRNVNFLPAQERCPTRGAVTMFDLLARTAADTGPIGPMFGVAALLCAFAWPFCRRHRTMLLVQAAGTTALALYFAAQGLTTAASTCAVSLVQLLMAALIQHRGRLLAAYAATVPISVCLIAASWLGIPSAFAAIGAILCSTARLQRNKRPMMLVFLGATPFWVGHNFLTGSGFGLALDGISMIGNGFGLICIRNGLLFGQQQAGVVSSRGKASRTAFRPSYHVLIEDPC